MCVMRAVFDLVSDEEMGAWFGCSAKRVRGARRRHGLKRPGVFAPKGPTGSVSPATEFKKGQRPQNAKPIGSIFVRVEKGRPVKLLSVERGKPIPYARFVWERDNGPVPSGHFVTFRDEDPLNCEPGNLCLISRADNARRNMAKVNAKERAVKIWKTRRRRKAFQDAWKVYGAKSIAA